MRKHFTCSQGHHWEVVLDGQFSAAVELLLNEVVHSLDNPTPEEVEQELIDLGWQRYCQAALDRRRGR